MNMDSPESKNHPNKVLQRKLFGESSKSTVVTSSQMPGKEKTNITSFFNVSAIQKSNTKSNVVTSSQMPGKEQVNLANFFNVSVIQKSNSNKTI